ncbi:acetyl-CoA carboxylase, biotin carboxylase subunit [Desulfacinum infernum DSM 9756]|uniref:Acetyl-CoA carboxylase, biotin carboxylase subunit n=1 Tax=Desulfacinum infernum DSM 9756 TaxID=1121391 RepID=A0A1M5ARR7_9BACT|nr:acetyl-CoA carboxylase biotin carboxylase subunit [Desulfacinum infernum]SHF32885.1 acetyl-CoA carboxylase, biotin carboxylase subunit [Desulfacinum infernum DSM 9756]
MFKKLLVANRGEIAIRIMRSAQELGIRTVAIYEETDKTAMHIMKSDEAVCIGSGPRKDYLDIDRIIQAAKAVGADAIHPGYGFLAENPLFSKRCTDNGLIFVGPPPQVISDMGSKVIARKVMTEAGIPVIPGSGVLAEGQDGEKEALEFARLHGFPIMVKAVAGGGGRGIRAVKDTAELIKGLRLARSEARMAFGDDRIYLEKGLQNPRHVEVQILADGHGNVIHLGTRNCSIQRRHQKMIEIAPASLPALVEERICADAVRAAQATDYVNAGTVEFLVDSEDQYYFLEVNTRIQVEHTVTEMVTGVDIVREQLRIAAGEPLSFRQEDVQVRGYAIELRINAEDPKNGFMPSPGLIRIYQSPGGHGVRLDGCIYQGYEIPRYYDSMLVKLTVYGFTWREAVDRLRRALDGFSIVGVKTTIPFYKQIVEDPDFIHQNFDTSYIDTHPQLLDYREEVPELDRLARLIAEINAYGYNPYAESA